MIASPVTQYGFAAFSLLNPEPQGAAAGDFRAVRRPAVAFPGDDRNPLKTGKAEGYEIALLIDLSLDDVPEVRLAGPAEKAASVETLRRTESGNRAVRPRQRELPHFPCAAAAAAAGAADQTESIKDKFHQSSEDL